MHLEEQFLLEYFLAEEQQAFQKRETTAGRVTADSAIACLLVF